MKNILLLLIMIFIFSACLKNEDPMEMGGAMEDPVEEPIDSDTIKLLWRTPLVASDTTLASTWRSPAFNDDFVYNSYDEFEHNYANPNVYKFDAITGAALGPWDRFLYDENLSFASNTFIALEDQLVIECTRSVYLVDYNTDEILHSQYLDYSNRVTVDKGLMFASNLVAQEEYSELIYKDLSNLSDWKSLYKKENDGENSKEELIMASADYNEFGDTIVYMLQRAYDFDINKESSGLRAFNLSKQEIVWEKADVEPHGIGSVQNKLLIDGDMLYFCGGTRIHCLNRHNGDYIWMRDFQQPEFFGNTNYFTLGDKMYFHSSLGNQFYLDKYTGQIEFQAHFSGSADNLAYGNGYIIFATGGLYVLDDQTGQVLYNIDAPYHKGNFAGHVSYDAKNNRLYADDGYFLYALELPEK